MLWHFDFEICFLPQRRTIFQHPNCQDWSEASVLCALWLGNVLRATRPAIFRHLNFQKGSENRGFWHVWHGNALRAHGVQFSDIRSSKSGPKLCFAHVDLEMCSRHNGAQCFFSHLARWLRTRHFSEPTFRTSDPHIIGKTQCFATFPTFCTCIFYLLTLSLSLFYSSLFYSDFLSDSSISAFHLSILSEVWHLKLPLMNQDRLGLSSAYEFGKQGTPCAPHGGWQAQRNGETRVHKKSKKLVGVTAMMHGNHLLMDRLNVQSSGNCPNVVGSSLDRAHLPWDMQETGGWPYNSW